ncbi:Haemolysin XhlA [Paenibacillus sp. UNCCL117]|uniref:hemolysin XhlA family protein n=1 Tax=unclassified Paenibacillus TaxID=185978 RepID=UPI000892412E|nr:MULTISPECIES: hemolysin XhlA family protein [unclassified Paenibacillus]SDD29332.1 Haemolysin XhlA [Paenibacillus sp. cl123]SFW40739.1 Haemolysin XhlA [Paenibacillus sp. UNCCL117]
MPVDDIKMLTEQMTGVRLDLARLETKLDAIKDLSKKVEEIDDLAKEAMQSTKAAHKRLDMIDKVINWAGTTIIGSVLLAVIALVIKK